MSRGGERERERERETVESRERERGKRHLRDPIGDIKNERAPKRERKEREREREREKRERKERDVSAAGRWHPFFKKRSSLCEKKKKKFTSLSPHY